VYAQIPMALCMLNSFAIADACSIAYGFQCGDIQHTHMHEHIHTHVHTCTHMYTLAHTPSNL